MSYPRVSQSRWSQKTYSTPCLTCQKETPHRKSICVYCKTVNQNPYITKREQAKHEWSQQPFAVRMRNSSKLRSQMNHDKREAAARAAAEARKKLGVTE